MPPPHVYGVMPDRTDPHAGSADEIRSEELTYVDRRQSDESHGRLYCG
jgi:hypothetical protein